MASLFDAVVISGQVGIRKPAHPSRAGRLRLRR